jgi:hypothetical protein
MSIANELKKSLPVENQGLKEIEVYKGMKLPEDYEITELLGDMIMVEFADCDESGDLINRGGIYINSDVTRNTWRIAQIVMVGPLVPENLQPGKYIMFPNDKGIPAVAKNGKARSFLNAERIFGIVEPKD